MLAVDSFGNGTCESYIEYHDTRTYYLDFTPKSKYLVLLTKKKLLIRSLAIEMNI